MMTLVLTVCVHLFGLPYLTLITAALPKEDFKLSLSNTGPVILGSDIVFQAQLLAGTGQAPKDESHFKYEWWSTLDLETETQHADYNTSLTKCYDDEMPGKYEMVVTVYDLHSTEKRKIVARKTQHFDVTENLNGKLKPNQTLDFRNPNVTDIYSTGKNIELNLNLTDMLISSPDMIYTWNIDGDKFATTSTPNFTAMISDAGLHNVTVDVESSEPVSFGCIVEKQTLTGHFHSHLNLKDPVSDVELYGKNKTKKNEEIRLTLMFNGSEPYSVCWRLEHVNRTRHYFINESCDIQNTTTYEIYLVSKLKPGEYVVNINVSNDVSQQQLQHFLTVVDDRNVPSHDAAFVVVPVIAGLIFVCLILAAGVYVNKYRARIQHVETADFDFHPEVSLTVKQEQKGSFLENVKYSFRNSFRKKHNSSPTDNESNSRYTRVRQMNRYGSMGNSIET